MLVAIIEQFRLNTYQIFHVASLFPDYHTTQQKVDIYPPIFCSLSRLINSNYCFIYNYLSQFELSDRSRWIQTKWSKHTTLPFAMVHDILGQDYLSCWRYIVLFDMPLETSL